MGVYVTFVELLTVYTAFGLRRGERWAWCIGLATALVNSANAVGAVAVGFRHPPALAWLVVSLSLSVLLLAVRGDTDGA